MVEVNIAIHGQCTNRRLEIRILVVRTQIKYLKWFTVLCPYKNSQILGEESEVRGQEAQL